MKNNETPVEELTQVPDDGIDPPPKNMEDGTKVDAMFKEAASFLEYDKEPAPIPKANEDAIAEEELAIEEPAKVIKKAPKKAKAPVEEPVAEPEVSAEPVKSKRELFREKADADKSNREKENRLKEREIAALEAENRYKDFQTDPIAYLEKLNPKAYEEWTARNINAGSTPEQAENAAIRAELEELRKEVKGTHETATTQLQQANYIKYMSDANHLIASEEFADVRKDAALHEAFNGRPIDIDKVIASVWSEYKTNHEIDLTPRQCCEIILEDAQAHLDSVPKSEVLRALYGPIEKPAESKTPTKKKTPPTGKTLTNAQETASEPAQEKDFSEFTSKSDLYDAVAGTLEYEDTPEE